MKKESKLSRLLRELLNKEADPAFQPPDLSDGLLTSGEVIAREVVKAACMGKEWAILMVRDGTEGKPGQAVKDDTNDRSTEEALEDVTRKRLNDLAGGGIGHADPVAADAPVNVDPKPEPKDSGVDADRPRAADRPTGAAQRLLDLPRDGDRHSQR